jgi:hypothetical protein
LVEGGFEIFYDFLGQSGSVRLSESRLSSLRQQLSELASFMLERSDNLRSGFQPNPKECSWQISTSHLNFYLLIP